MEENNIDASQINLRNKGTKLSLGKIYKGCVKDAFTKLSIGSIPSNYQSIIYHHQQKKGFGTSQKRFNVIQNRSEQLKGVDNDTCQIEKEPQVRNVSESKKGYGPLIAKQRREWLKLSHAPGPGKYFKQKLQKFKETKQHRKRKCYTVQRQNQKRKQLQLTKQNHYLPGPGYYQSINPKTGQIIGCKSSFISKERRQAYIPKSLTPGPGCYITKQQNQSNSNEKKRQCQQQEYFKKIVKQKRPKSRMFLQRHTNNEIPGPGYYDSELPNFKPLYERIKISNNFMESSKDRFNNSPDKVKQVNEPSMCTYQIQSPFDKIEKRLIDMPCFMSQSVREPFKGDGLGPNVFFEGNKEQKRNFHFNISGDWV